MASLKDQLIKILPDILPASPSDSIGGTQLIEKIIPYLTDKYAEGSLRTHLSILAGDPTSPLAKIDQGYGYYLRQPIQRNLETKAPDSADIASNLADDEAGRRGEQREEKFRSIYIRWAELNNLFPMHIEHTKAAKQKAGINIWKFPDIVTIKWEVGEVTDRGFKLKKDLLEVKRSLGEQPFKLSSIELKVELTASTLRQSFFQCVSNSKWAHSANLVVACKLTDETVADELRRLGASYDVNVISFGLTPEKIDSLPSADTILRASPSQFEGFITNLMITKTSVARDRETLDWEHIRDLRVQNTDINDLFTGLHSVLKRKRPILSQTGETCRKWSERFYKRRKGARLE